MRQVTSSDIISIERELLQVDPNLLGDPAMIAAMACRLDESHPDEATVRMKLAYYVAFRWPQFKRSLERSLARGALTGLLLRDVERRSAHRN